MDPNTNNSFRRYISLNKAYNREDYIKNTKPEQDCLLKNKQYHPKPDIVENYRHKW
ncbi:MAG: hypothetical protein QXT19_04605 [Candidatus Woesearchaeota archaeon]